jgi:hypothetical protein
MHRQVCLTANLIFLFSVFCCAAGEAEEWVGYSRDFLRSKVLLVNITKTQVSSANTRTLIEIQ